MATANYDKELNKLDNSYIEVAISFGQKFSISPYIGKPLSYKFFREVRIREKRLYFLVYDNIKIVLLIGITDKKDQQEFINKTKNELDEYRKLAEETSKQLF